MKFTATFISATRKGTSRNGNPTWDLVTSDGVFRTQTDSSVGYSVSNYTGGPDSLIGQEVEFEATNARRVFGMKRASK